MKPHLSICIPTFNRRKLLDELLLSILNQIKEFDANDIEICISDNASTDGTEDFVLELKKKSPIKIVYSKNKENLGADANYLRSVELAQGDYCWFIGSDDLVAPGSVRNILSEIKFGHDIYMCNRIECDYYMAPLRKCNWLEGSASSVAFNLSEPTEFLRYTKRAKTLGALFSYLSAIIFKRDKWLRIHVNPIVMGTAYSHVYMLLSFIKTGCVLKYIPNYLVLSRGGNDSFLPSGSDGIVKRVMLDIKGYLLIANTLFRDVKDYKNGILRVLRVERPVLQTLVRIRLRVDSATWVEIAQSFRDAGYSSFMIFLIGVSKKLLVFVKLSRT